MERVQIGWVGDRSLIHEASDPDLEPTPWQYRSEVPGCEI